MLLARVESKGSVLLSENVRMSHLQSFRLRSFLSVGDDILWGLVSPAPASPEKKTVSWRTLCVFESLHIVPANLLCHAVAAAVEGTKNIML